MKLHVVGVIFHGGSKNEEGVNSDLISLFAALPHLAGNSDLNCECLYRALKLQACKLCLWTPPRVEIRVGVRVRVRVRVRARARARARARGRARGMACYLYTCPIARSMAKLFLGSAA
eukprot:3134526-Pleurochrysis_carterae.AAC.1